MRSKHGVNSLHMSTSIDDQPQHIQSQSLQRFLALSRLHRGESVDAYDDVAGAYDVFAKIWDGYVAAPALHYFKELIRLRIKPGALVLDAGAGTGLRTQALLQNSEPARVVALDASRQMLSAAAGKIHDARVIFQEGDLTRLPFAPDTFDAVICTWAIETLEYPREAVREFVRVIRPGGVVLYAFCSLPAGRLGEVSAKILERVASNDGPLSHWLPQSEWPFHECAFSSLKQFSGGLTTVATVGKCCPISDQVLPCRLDS